MTVNRLGEETKSTKSKSVLITCNLTFFFLLLLLNFPPSFFFLHKTANNRCGRVVTLLPSVCALRDCSRSKATLVETKAGPQSTGHMQYLYKPPPRHHQQALHPTLNEDNRKLELAEEEANLTQPFFFVFRTPVCVAHVCVRACAGVCVRARSESRSLRHAL